MFLFKQTKYALLVCHLFLDSNIVLHLIISYLSRTLAWQLDSSSSLLDSHLTNGVTLSIYVLTSRENNCLPLLWRQEADLYIHREVILEGNGIDTTKDSNDCQHI